MNRRKLLTDVRYH